MYARLYSVDRTSRRVHHGDERAATLGFYDEQARKLERVELQIRLRGEGEVSS